jgi:hypothetical protein
MRRVQGTTAALLAAMLVFAGLAFAEESPAPTRDEYRAQVEPICQHDAETGSRILQGARARVRHEKFAPASKQFFRAATAFGRTIRSLEAVPRPIEDDARLQKWFRFLHKIQAYLRTTGKALKEKNKVKALHETIRAERSGNAANNVSSVFDFRECRLSPSRFS